MKAIHCLAITGLVAATAACLLIANAVDAGGTVCDSVGPDVIVGEITGPSNYSASGGIEAFALGTTSCNIGDEELLWISNSVSHPVISQNLYRLKDGRFEQVGQAWLKHGFTALQQNACGCGCQSSGTGTRLGVGCSDPYSSGLNGSQSGMGPKFQVNAYNGAFIWPPFNFNNTGNTIYKRLQVAISDLDPAQNGGGSYFAESQYIAPDDATQGNGLNNASWRNANVSGSGSSWSLSMSGSTQREEPAIYAWQNADPDVGITNVDVPGEGRFVLGWKVTPNGPDFDYEFALFNLNSDRSGGGFTVDLPAGASKTNIGFHDVDYHSGEPWDGADWTPSTTSDSISWNTADFNSNPNANALRWATMYNFRFTSDASPAEVDTVEVTLFKPGSPTSVVVPLIGGGGPLLAFDFPDGLPDTVDPAGGTTVRVDVTSVFSDPVPGTGMFYYDTGGGFTSTSMAQLNSNEYEATFPASDCPTTIDYYFSAESALGTTEFFPAAAPSDVLTTISLVGIADTFTDDFETDQGWTVSGNATDGQWDRGTPVGGGDRGDPPTDADGSGQCYLTDNEDGNSDVDGGSTTLTSPSMDATGDGAAILSYYRWYSNASGGSPEEDIFVVEISDDGGASWEDLETVGPSGSQVDGDWFLLEWDLDSIAGITRTDSMRIRFTAEDAGSGSVVEAGVDGVVISVIDCGGDCPADLTGDGMVSVDDLLLALGAWGGPGGDVDGDGTTDINDLLAVLGAWGPCP